MPTNGILVGVSKFNLEQADSSAKAAANAVSLHELSVINSLETEHTAEGGLNSPVLRRDHSRPRVFTRHNRLPDEPASPTIVTTSQGDN